jgi:hypothetical protein
MSEIIRRPEWNEFLRNFSKLHRGKRTRLGVFEIRDGVVNDLWIEDGVPLLGIDVDTKEGRQTIGIAFENFRHSIENALTISRVNDGEEVGDGLDIEDDEGKTTALRFEDEDYAVESED